MGTDAGCEKAVSSNGVLHIMRGGFSTLTLCGCDAWFWDYWGVDADTPADCLRCIASHRARQGAQDE